MTVDLHLNVAEVVDGAWDAGKTDLHGMYSKDRPGRPRVSFDLGHTEEVDARKSVYEDYASRFRDALRNLKPQYYPNDDVELTVETTPDQGFWDANPNSSFGDPLWDAAYDAVALPQRADIGLFADEGVEADGAAVSG